LAIIRCMARTTIDLDDGVLRELRRRREREGRPIGVIASELLARALADSPPPMTSFRWGTRRMGASVDLDDKDAIWAVLDRE